ncbi:hypothetical protein [Candidatus Trichorickettsia mobilis]|uniref:hypothetical protein n=1 Tax=Candidatus Trichorickettsia mobilis TaxID=1346319 RepID=UPI0029304F83|nr:hypothetical protein [Candidatus Trichorickettsia mobilis]
MHEATHAACGEFFDNSFKPYSKIINGKKEKEFAKHIDRLVANKAIIDTYKLTNWSEGQVTR